RITSSTPLPAITRATIARVVTGSSSSEYDSAASTNGDRDDQLTACGTHCSRAGDPQHDRRPEALEPAWTLLR
ncbi:MAG: hypothetical protein ACOYMR_14725, partial [Ilumatobacteraceae bacterium]